MRSNGPLANPLLGSSPLFRLLDHERAPAPDGRGGHAPPAVRGQVVLAELAGPGAREKGKGQGRRKKTITYRHTGTYISNTVRQNVRRRLKNVITCKITEELRTCMYTLSFDAKLVQLA